MGYIVVNTTNIQANVFDHRDRQITETATPKYTKKQKIDTLISRQLPNNKF